MVADCNPSRRGRYIRRISDIDDSLDELYRAELSDFMAVRTRLAAAAKKRGDPDGARRIRSVRKPTVPAWVVNRLALDEPGAVTRLTELGDRLRQAHTARDGEAIRELSAQQRRVIAELGKAALRAAGQDTASAAVRDEVTATLQAAVADPEVAGRLGRLSRPEQWSGFGFAAATDEPAATKPAATKPARTTEPPDRAAKRERMRAAHEAALAAARRAQAEADAVLAERRSARAAARERVEQARADLADAEAARSRAERDHDEAATAAAQRADLVERAAAALRELR
ncbi:hypothetical protein LV457_17025 [Mycobacterium sp. MYCO198283]|uniref:hypothetical protein n=1 Tax=Mycobacterium sp. MYCO198283 TaxID=2883505 RepID=UPI001E3078F1|nr:hypothetical protein [Mycobacterium sp. MYCO198283]MCG5433976.1 hypothetical protein [Mycobacterium sp. MYCO198283]